MGVNKLKLEHFGNDLDLAFHHADVLLDAQRVEYPQAQIDHPPKIFPNNKMLDQFWYCWTTGLDTNHKEKHEQLYKMGAKLSDKNLKMISQQGEHSKLGLNMATPHLANMVDIKNEHTEITDLEKTIKARE